MATKNIQFWDLWIADAGSTGISFARGRCDATDRMIVHAPPEQLSVTVRDEKGNTITQGQSLKRTADTPMARLRRQGNTIKREDIWPTEADSGMPVFVAGGEIGTLLKWWNDEQHTEWRWSLEFYNHR